jgi:DNA-binding transcriptional MerR regulator
VDNGRTYTAEQLAEKANVSLRTVRYYIQEGLIEAPESRGPGAHFTNTHLSQLLRIRLMQDAGFDLKTIKELGPAIETSTMVLAKSPELRAAAMKIVEARRLARRARADEPDEPDEDEKAERLDARSAIRIPMADGVELMVDPKRKIPSPKDLVEIALLIRKTFARK